MSEDLQFGHDEPTARYVATDQATVVSEIHYRLGGTVVTVTSTVTDPASRGAGIAGRLTRFALDDVRARGLRVVPRCPYTADWISRHPAYADLLA